MVPVLDEEVEVLCLLPPTLDAADFPRGDVAAGLDELPLSFLDLLAQFQL